MSDIVERLRNKAKWAQHIQWSTTATERLEWLAADEIERLRADNARMREALERIADHETYFPDSTNANRAVHQCVHRKRSDEKCADCQAHCARAVMEPEGR